MIDLQEDLTLAPENLGNTQALNLLQPNYLNQNNLKDFDLEEKLRLELQCLEFVKNTQNKYRLAYFSTAKEYSKNNPDQPFLVECTNQTEVYLLALNYFPATAFRLLQKVNANGSFSILICPLSSERNNYPDFEVVEIEALNPQEYALFTNSNKFTGEELEIIKKKSTTANAFTKGKQFLAMASKVATTVAPSFIPIVGRGVTQSLNMMSKIQKNGSYFQELSSVEKISDLIENAQKVAKGLEALTFGDNFEWQRYYNVGLDETTGFPILRNLDISKDSLENAVAIEYLKEASRLENGFSGMTELTNILSKAISFNSINKSEKNTFLDLKNILIPLYKVMGDKELFKSLRKQGLIELNYEDIFNKEGTVSFSVVLNLIFQLKQIAKSNPSLFKTIFSAESQYAYNLVEIKDVKKAERLIVSSTKTVRTMQSKTAVEFAFAGAFAGSGFVTIAQGAVGATEIVSYRMGARKAKKNLSQLRKSNFKGKTADEIRESTLKNLTELDSTTLKDAALSAAFELAVGKLLLAEGIFDGNATGKVADYVSRIVYAALATMPQAKKLLADRQMQDKNFTQIVQYLLTDDDVKNKFLTIMSGMSIGAGLFAVAKSPLEDVLEREVAFKAPPNLTAKSSDLETSLNDNRLSSNIKPDLIEASQSKAISSSTDKNILDSSIEILPVAQTTNVIYPAPPGFTHLRSDYQQMLVNSSLTDRVLFYNQLDNIVVPWVNNSNGGVFQYNGNHYQIAFEAFGSQSGEAIPAFLINWNGQGVDYINYLNDLYGIRINTGATEYIAGITLESNPNITLIFARDLPNDRFHLAYMGPLNVDPYSTPGVFIGNTYDSIVADLVNSQNLLLYAQTNIYRIPFNSRFEAILIPEEVNPIIQRDPIPIIPPTPPVSEDGNLEVVIEPPAVAVPTGNNFFDAAQLGYLTQTNATPEQIEFVLKTTGTNPLVTYVSDLMVHEDNASKSFENLIRFQSLIRLSQNNEELFLRNVTQTPRALENAITLSRFIGLTPESADFANLKDVHIPPNSPFVNFINQIVDEFETNNTNQEVANVIPEIRLYLSNGLTFDESIRIFDILNLENFSSQIINYLNANPSDATMESLINDLISNYQNQNILERITDISGDVDWGQVGLVALLGVLIVGATYVGVKNYPKFRPVTSNSANPPVVSRSNQPQSTDNQNPQAQDNRPDTASQTRADEDARQSAAFHDADDTITRRIMPLTDSAGSSTGDYDTDFGMIVTDQDASPSQNSSADSKSKSEELNPDKNPFKYNLNKVKRIGKKISDSAYEIPISKDKSVSLIEFINKSIDEYLNNKKQELKTQKDFDEFSKNLNSDKLFNEILAFVQSMLNEFVKTAIENDYKVKSQLKLYSLFSTGSKDGLRSLVDFKEFKELVNKYFFETYNNKAKEAKNA